MYVPNFNFHFTLKSYVQKEAMQAKKKYPQNYNDFSKQHTNRFKAPSVVQPFLQVYYDNGVLKAGTGKDKPQC